MHCMRKSALNADIMQDKNALKMHLQFAFNTDFNVHLKRIIRALAFLEFIE